jgi:micrococcal nuclease
VDVVLVLYANDLQSAEQALEVGSQITLPTRAADLCVPGNEPLQSVVAGVVDGDTVNIQLEEMLRTVNYIGILAPALAPVPEPFGVEALNANRALVDGQSETLIEETTESEPSGQLPRYVLAGDVFVNYEQVRQGFAQAVSNEVDTTCDDLFILAEQQARLDGLGMWLLQTPGAATPAAPATAVPTAPPPAATLTPTSTSSLGFSCNCKPNFVWGNFTNQAQADVCRGICEIAAARRQALCATAYASGSSLGAAVCK